MNASFSKTAPNERISVLFLIALMGLIVINFTLYLGTAGQQQLSLVNAPVRNTLGVSMTSQSMIAPVPVPTPPAGQIQPNVTPVPTKAAQPAPVAQPVPTPPVKN